MERAVEEALREAIRIEKKSYDFYRHAAEVVDSETTCEVFRYLAGEEAEHMESFLDLYPGRECSDLLDLMRQPPDLDQPAYRELLNGVRREMNAEKALTLSLREEKACIALYSTLVEGFSDPDVRKVFERALDETHQHCSLIDEECDRVRRRFGRRDNG